MSLPTEPEVLEAVYQQPESDAFYGIDVLLTDDGDLSVDAAGRLLSLAGPLNCGQAILMRLRTHLGELPLQEEYGSLLAEKVLGTHSDVTLTRSQLNAELRAAMEADARFLRARNVRVERDPATNELAAALELVLAAGDVLAIEDADDAFAASVTVEPAALDEPSDDDLAEFVGTDEDDEDDVPDIDDALDDGLLGPDGGEDSDLEGP